MSSRPQIPDFPYTYGDGGAREFGKDGKTYRMVRHDGETVYISRVGTSTDEFWIKIDDITHNGHYFDAWGFGSLSTFTIFGCDRDRLSAKLV